MHSVSLASLFALAAATMLVACSEGDCPGSRRLEEACDFACPQGREEAIAEICGHPDSTGQWQEGPNSCGSWTVRSLWRGSGIQYDVLPDGSTRNVVGWSQFPACHASFVDPCKPAGVFTTGSCPFGE